MSSILKVDQLQDSGGNAIITSNGSGTITVNSQPFKNGITMADQWCLTTDFSGDANPISSNLARYTSDNSGYFGTGMTESSGVFTFPETGIYLIKFTISFALTNADSNAQQGIIRISTDGGSVFGDASTSIQSQFRWGTTVASYVQNNVDYIFDVTNVSNDKCAFRIDVSDNNTITRGNTNVLETSMQFIRLGDT